jgi:hypothetical protein
MPNIKEALKEAKEVLGRIFKALQLEYVIADDIEPEIDGIVIKELKGGWETDGFAGMVADVVQKHNEILGEDYEEIEYTVYVIRYCPGSRHEPPSWDDEPVVTTKHTGEAVEALALAVVKGIVQIELERYGDEQYEKEMAEVEAEMELQRPATYRTAKAARKRCASSSMMATAIPASFFARARKFQLVITRHSVSSEATTDAVRGPSDSRANSPKKSAGSRTLTTAVVPSGRMWTTSAFPETTIKRPTPVLPWVTISLPSSNWSAWAILAKLSNCRLLRLLNNGTLDKKSTVSFTLGMTLPPVYAPNRRIPIPWLDVSPPCTHDRVPARHPACLYRRRFYHDPFDLSTLTTAMTMPQNMAYQARSTAPWLAGPTCPAYNCRKPDEIIRIELEAYGDEKYAEDMAEAEAEMERQREHQELLSEEWAIREGLLEEEAMREMLCAEV